MSINPLNDISRVYLEQVAESAVPGKPAEKLGAVTAIPKSERDAARERTLAKAKSMREKKDNKTKALDPVGNEDADIDNDGKKGTNADKYLMKRRKAIGKAISTQEAKEVKRWWDDDGDGKGYEEGEVSGKFKKKKKIKEGFSNWRQDLSEVMDVVDKEQNDKKITEKKVNNKIKINPSMGEAVENLGGTLLEMVEIDEVDYIVESVYVELLEEGYEEDDIEEAIEYSLTEAKVTFGHDTATEKKKSGLMTAAKARLSSLKKSAKQAVATGARKVAKGALKVARKVEGGDKTPSSAHTGTRKASTYRGAGVGQKERVSSGSYQAPTKKKAEKPADPWEGSASTPPKAKAKKPKAVTKTTKAPAPKRKRKSKLDDLLASVRSENVQLDELGPLGAGLALGGAALAGYAIKKASDTMQQKREKVTAPSTSKPTSSSSLSDKMRSRNQQMRDLMQVQSYEIDGDLVDEQSFDINSATHRQQQRIEKATKLQQATKGAESSAASAAVKRLGGSGVSLPLANSYEVQGKLIDEKTLSKTETKKKEEIVKSMKDKAADFEKRYPGRGKEVMYATATKLAKKIAR
jgi:hypothetical protein